MTEPITETECRELAERLELCWHEPFTFIEGMTEQECIEKDCKCKKCGKVFTYPNCNYDKWNLNFLDPRVVLREMRKNCWRTFRECFETDDDGDACDPVNRFRDLMLDETGQLAKKFLEWLRREGK